MFGCENQLCTLRFTSLLVFIPTPNTAHLMLLFGSPSLADKVVRSAPAFEWKPAGRWISRNWVGYHRCKASDVYIAFSYQSMSPFLYELSLREGFMMYKLLFQVIFYLLWYSSEMYHGNSSYVYTWINSASNFQWFNIAQFFKKAKCAVECSSQSLVANSTAPKGGVPPETALHAIVQMFELNSEICLMEPLQTRWWSRDCCCV